MTYRRLIPHKLQRGEATAAKITVVQQSNDADGDSRAQGSQRNAASIGDNIYDE